jgi:hypothetical protein
MYVSVIGAGNAQITGCKHRQGAHTIPLFDLSCERQSSTLSRSWGLLFVPDIADKAVRGQQTWVHGIIVA